jgi:hypothetical protein
LTGAELKNAPELAARLALADARELLLIDVPESLERLLAASRPPDALPRTVASRALRSVKQRFDAIVLWREDRAGSRSVFDSTVKRLEPDGVLWVVIASRKVIGPETPAARRLGAGDLARAFAPAGLGEDMKVRVSAWHVAHRFGRRKTGPGAGSREP